MYLGLMGHLFCTVKLIKSVSGFVGILIAKVTAGKETHDSHVTLDHFPQILLMNYESY